MRYQCGLRIVELKHHSGRIAVMARWIVRKDLDGMPVDTPLRVTTCTIARAPGVLSVEEHAALLLRDGERLQPNQEHLWIDRQGERVGYFEVLEAAPDAGA
jgi:hypothetical protein